MKKYTVIGMILALTLLLAACGGQSAGTKASSSNGSAVTQLMESAAQEAETPEAETAAAETEPASVLQTPGGSELDLSSADADVDLTLLSSTMVYSEVSQMMYEPETYVGKTVKMEGAFAVYEGEGRNYYACIISDAAACCANGIEFLWSGEHAYPADYPEPGTDITVVGTFDLYEENGYLYCQLEDAALSF